MKSTAGLYWLLLNLTALAYIFYCLFIDGFGPYKMSRVSVDFNHSENVFGFKFLFLIAVGAAVVVPIVLFAGTRYKSWIIQFPIALILCASWKSDFMQRTLFYYTVTSAYAEIQHGEGFIADNEESIIAYANYVEEIGLDSLAFNPYEHEHLETWQDSITITRITYDDAGSRQNWETLHKFVYPEHIKKSIENLQIRMFYKYGTYTYFEIGSRTVVGQRGYFSYHPHGHARRQNLHNGNDARENFYLPYCESREYYYDDKWKIILRATARVR